MYTQTCIVLKLILVNSHKFKGALCDFGGEIQIQRGQGQSLQLKKCLKTHRSKAQGNADRKKQAATQKHQEQNRWERGEEKA